MNVVAGILALKLIVVLASVYAVSRVAIGKAESSFGDKFPVLHLFGITS